jgi:hypothetical protein
MKLTTILHNNLGGYTDEISELSLNDIQNYISHFSTPFYGYFDNFDECLDYLCNYKYFKSIRIDKHHLTTTIIINPTHGMTGGLRLGGNDGDFGANQGI